VKVKSAGPPSSLAQLHSTRPVTGLTHGFYRYPATSSLELVREVVLAHISEYDYVFDPFMGGGVASVEALAGGRRAIGRHLNSLATFFTRVKTMPLRLWSGTASGLADRPLGPG
jgi:DNA modification methylase